MVALRALKWAVKLAELMDVSKVGLKVEQMVVSMVEPMDRCLAELMVES